MANSTFSGPVRSQNGFQEWNGTAWVPVAGGGGGGGAIIELGDGASASNIGVPDNRYSEDMYSTTPTGATAGNIIQLPVIGVNEAYKIRTQIGTASTVAAWAIQLPAIPGTDISAFIGGDFAANFITAQVFNPTLGTYVDTPAVFAMADTTISGPTDTMYLYGIFEAAGNLEITRYPNLVVPGFGAVAVFGQTGIPLMGYGTIPIGDPFIYPWTQLLYTP